MPPLMQWAVSSRIKRHICFLGCHPDLQSPDIQSLRLDVAIDANQQMILIPLENGGYFPIPFVLIFFVRENSPPASSATFMPLSIRSDQGMTDGVMIRLANQFYRKHISCKALIFVPSGKNCPLPVRRWAQRTVPTTSDLARVQSGLRVGCREAIQSVLVFSPPLPALEEEGCQLIGRNTIPGCQVFTVLAGQVHFIGCNRALHIKWRKQADNHLFYVLWLGGRRYEDQGKEVGHPLCLLPQRGGPS